MSSELSNREYLIELTKKLCGGDHYKILACGDLRSTVYIERVDRRMDVEQLKPESVSSGAKYMLS